MADESGKTNRDGIATDLERARIEFHRLLTQRTRRLGQADARNTMDQ